MGDSLLKRQRDIEELEENANPKRQMNCNDDDQILRSLFEVDEDEPHQDLSSLMTSLEQELYSDHYQSNTAFFTASSSDIENPTPSANSTILDDDRDSVIRHLLEASDEELGIPNRVIEEDENGSNNDNDNDNDNNSGGDSSVSSMSLVIEGLWELEDEAANYYTLLQSELFL